MGSLPKSHEAASIRYDPAALLNIQFPEECREGIEANLELVRYHARILDNYLTRSNTAALTIQAPESCP